MTRSGIPGVLASIRNFDKLIQASKNETIDWALPIARLVIAHVEKGMCEIPQWKIENGKRVFYYDKVEEPSASPRSRRSRACPSGSSSKSASVAKSAA